MSNVPDYHLLNNTLLVSAVLFSVGAMGVVARRNRVTLVVSFGILIEASLIATIGFSSFHSEFRGRLLWVFVFSAAIVLSGVAAGIAYLAESANRRRISSDDETPTEPDASTDVLRPPHGGDDV